MLSLRFIKKYVLCFCCLLSFVCQSQDFNFIDVEIGVRNSLDFNRGKFADFLFDPIGIPELYVKTKEGPGLQQNYFLAIGFQFSKSDRFRIKLSTNNLNLNLEGLHKNYPNRPIITKPQNIGGHFYSGAYERKVVIKKVHLWIALGLAYEKNDLSELTFYFNGLDWTNWAIEGGVSSEIKFTSDVDFITRIGFHRTLKNTDFVVYFDSDNVYLPTQVGVDIGFRFSFGRVGKKW